MRWLTLLALLAGCGPGVKEQFFVHRDDADLPVWLQGDRFAPTFVVVQHGLGASGRVYDWQPAFDALEERYAIVYWDQRGAGISQGNEASASLGIDASVTDLEQVLAVVRARYAPRRVVLLGHSLGGALSQAFLRDPERESGIAGYVDVCGARNMREAWQTSAALLLERGRALSMDPAHSSLGDEMVSFYADRPDFPRGATELPRHVRFVEQVTALDGFDSEGSTAALTRELSQRGLAETFGGGFDALAFAQNTASFSARFDRDTVAFTAADVSTIPVPVLVLAGRFDYSVPVPVAQSTRDALSGRATLHVFERSSHFPMWDEPEAFTSTVSEFIDALP